MLKYLIYFCLWYISLIGLYYSEIVYQSTPQFSDYVIVFILALWFTAVVYFLRESATQGEILDGNEEIKFDK